MKKTQKQHKTSRRHKTSRKHKTNRRQKAGAGANRGQARAPTPPPPEITLTGSDVVQNFIEHLVNANLFLYNPGFSIKLRIYSDADRDINYERVMAGDFSQPIKREMIEAIDFRRSVQGDNEFIYQLTLYNYDPRSAELMLSQ
jgi:hypothetical protein